MSQDGDLPFEDRRQAGRRLGAALRPLRGLDRLLVLALPRGGVPVGLEVALALRAPMDVLVVRKIGHPQHAEFALGAIAAGGIRVSGLPTGLPAPAEADVLAVIHRESIELERRERLYRGAMTPLDLSAAHVVVVDDGLATGATMQAAVQAIRQRQPASIVVAVPVGSAAACRALQALADEVVCLARPQPFRAVGAWYRDFEQTSDEEVQALLQQETVAVPP